MLRCSWSTNACRCSMVAWSWYSSTHFLVLKCVPVSASSQQYTVLPEEVCSGCIPSPLALRKVSLLGPGGGASAGGGAAARGGGVGDVLVGAGARSQSGRAGGGPP